jgi:protocatechuate 3,4-dioxygenase beta subunit
LVEGWLSAVRCEHCHHEYGGERVKIRGWMFAVVALLGLCAFVAFEWLMWRVPSEPQGSAKDDTGAPVPHAAGSAGAPDEVTTVARGELRGRVLELGGTPIQDAVVCAMFERGKAAPGVLTEAARAPMCATTNASGAYELLGVEAGRTFKLGATAQGHKPQTWLGKNGDATLRLASDERRADVDLILTMGGVAVRGRVKDALGGVVPGALIAVTPQDGGATVPTTTDGKGEFIAWVAPGMVRVHATAAGYTEVSASGSAPQHRFELSLLPGSAIVGRAIERLTSAPVANAQIEAIATDQPGRKSARTNEDGSFRIEGLAPGKYRLEGLAPGLSGYARVTVLVGVADTSHETVVELERSPPVTAHVLESDTRAPCTAGEVTLHDKRVGEYAMGTIEADGAVHFTAVLPGTYAVDVSCDDHARKAKYAPVTVGAKPITELVWEVDRGSEVHGFVVDATGKPVANAQVRADPDESQSRPFTQTDAQGAFTLKGLAAGKYTVVASHESAGTETQQPLEVDGRRAGSDVRMQLGKGGRVTGTVVDQDNRPVASVTVNLYGPTYSRVETDDRGAFAATGLAPGNYRLGVSAGPMRLRMIGDKPEETSEVLQVSVPTGGEVKRALMVERRTGFIEGTVVDARGEGLPDFFVDALRTDRPQKGMRRGTTTMNGMNDGRVITDARGRFRIEALATGEYTVRAYRQSGVQGNTARIATGATDVKVQMAAPGAITGTVKVERGALPDRFNARISGNVHRSEPFFHTGGAFALSDLSPGTYQVEIDAPEGTGTGTVTLALGEIATLEITLTPKAEEPTED